MTIALCIPAYNAAGFLPRLLGSAQKQIIPFDEIIVCDDASRDGTATVAASFGAKVLVNEQNEGCSASKNHALQASRADWVHFHDADDELLPSFTQLAHRWIARPSPPDVLLFDYEYRDDETKESLGQSDFDAMALRRDPLRYAILHQINPFCGLYRRKRLLEVGGYDTDREVLYNEDVAFHCKLGLAGFSFDAEKEPSIINYRRTGSMSGANKPRCARAQFHVMDKVAQHLQKQGRLQSYAAPIAERLWDIATFAASFCDWEYVDRCIDLASKLGSARATTGNSRFRLLTSVSPRAAYRLREHLIRMFRPALRADYPRV